MEILKRLLFQFVISFSSLESRMTREETKDSHGNKRKKQKTVTDWERGGV